MTFNAGGTIVFSYTDGTDRWELRVPCADFDPVTFAYTGTGLKVPTEADIAATVANFGGVWAPYFDPTWTLALEALFHTSGGTGTRLPTLPSVADVTGTSSTPSSTNPPLMRGFRFMLDKGGRQVVRFFSVATTTTGARREVTATSGGFDSRDQALMAYLAGPSTGLVAWDGQIFPPTATAYQRYKLAPFERGGGGGGSSPPTHCITFPRGATICNDAADLVHMRTPGATHGWDLTGYALPHSGRIETQPPIHQSQQSGTGPTTRCLNLWNGSSNVLPPANWFQPDFDDSAWPLAAQIDTNNPAQVWDVPLVEQPNVNAQILFRQWVPLPSFTPTSLSAIGSVNGNNVDPTTFPNDYYVNGTLLDAHPWGNVSFTDPLDPSLLNGVGWRVLIAATIYATINVEGGDTVPAWLAYGLLFTQDISERVRILIGQPTDPPEQVCVDSDGYTTTIYVSGVPALVTPLPVLASSPPTLVGQDPSTGLPAFCPAPIPTTTTVVLGGGAGVQPAPPTQCVQVRCGVSAVLRDHLMSLYDDWRGWLDPFFEVCATLGVAVAVATVPWDWIADLGLAAAGGAIKGAIVTLTQGFVGAITANLLPSLDPDLKTHIQQAAFDALKCTGDQVQVSAAEITAWQTALAALTTWPLASLAGPFCGVLLQFTPLAAWQGAAATASPSHVCDLWP